MKKAQALIKQQVESYADSYKRVATFQHRISKRIDYILHSMAKAAKTQIVSDWRLQDNEWYYNGEIAPDRLSEDFIWVECVFGERNIFFTFDGVKVRVYDYMVAFPTKYLFEDFEEDLKKAIKPYFDKMRKEQDRTKERRLKREQEKLDKDKLIQSIKNKLSEEELNILDSII